MSYSRPIDDRRAAREHDEALSNHERAWNDMHEIGLSIGYDSPEYADARRAVVLLRQDIKRARIRAEKKRRWTR